MAELFSFTKTAEVLRRYAEDVREAYRRNLIQSDHLATEGLLNSVSTTVVFGNHSIAVDMNLAEYWKYVEYDTRPHWPPPSALLQWITVRNILPEPKDGKKAPTPKQLAFLIGRKISREGTKGSHDLEDAVREINRQYEQEIEDAITADLGNASDALISTFARG